jgi:hypothetical protein
MALFLAIVWARRRRPSREERLLSIVLAGCASAGGAAVTLYATAHSSWWPNTAETVAMVASVMPGLTKVLRVGLAGRVADSYAKFFARGLTALAALLAGRRRPALRAEWRAHLAGESGQDQVTWRKVKEASGFVASAIRCRCSDAADAAWTPADAVLKSRTLSNLLTSTPAALAALILFRHGGTIGLLGSAESVSAIYLMFYALVLAGRKYRNVKPPEPKARQVKE